MPDRPPVSALIDALAGAFPRVIATRGRAWTLAGQARLAQSGLIPPPAPREEWRRAPLGAEEGRRRAWDVPMLQEVAAILATEPRADHLRTLVRDTARRCGIARVLYALGKATESLRFELVRCALPADDPRSEDQIAAQMAIASAVTVSHLILAEADYDGHLPGIWGDRLMTVSPLPLVPDCPPPLRALHAVALSDWILRAGYRSSRGDIDERIESSAALIVGDAILLPQWSHALCLLALAGAEGDKPVRSAADARRAAVQALSRSFTGLEAFQGAALSALPAPTMPSWESRRECLDHATYALWPGVTVVDWPEPPLEGVILAPGGAGGHMWANVITTADLPRAPGIRVQLLMDIPSLTGGEDWAIAREDAGLSGQDPLALPLEAVRMCMVAANRKALGRRVPTGYVHAPRAPRRGDVSVTYIPRLRGDAPGADEGTVRRYPGIEAGAAHHVRPHLVAGHLRQIPLGWTPSAAARASARDAGLSLPERGYTYVRPHTRGDGTIEPHRVRVRRDREGRSADE